MSSNKELLKIKFYANITDLIISTIFIYPSWILIIYYIFIMIFSITNQSLDDTTLSTLILSLSVLSTLYFYYILPIYKKGSTIGLRIHNLKIDDNSSFLYSIKFTILYILFTVTFIYKIIERYRGKEVNLDISLANKERKAKSRPLFLNLVKILFKYLSRFLLILTDIIYVKIYNKKRKKTIIKEKQSPKKIKTNKTETKPKSVREKQSPKKIKTNKTETKPKSVKAKQSPKKIKTNKTETKPKSVKAKQSPKKIKTNKTETKPKSVKAKQSPKKIKTNKTKKIVKESSEK